MWVSELFHPNSQKKQDLLQIETNEEHEQKSKMQQLRLIHLKFVISAARVFLSEMGQFLVVQLTSQSAHKLVRHFSDVKEEMGVEIDLEEDVPEMELSYDIFIALAWVLVSCVVMGLTSKANSNVVTLMIAINVLCATVVIFFLPPELKIITIYEVAMCFVHCVLLAASRSQPLRRFLFTPGRLFWCIFLRVPLIQATHALLCLFDLIALLLECCRGLDSWLRAHLLKKWLLSFLLLLLAEIYGTVLYFSHKDNSPTMDLFDQTRMLRVFVPVHLFGIAIFMILSFCI